MTQREYTKIRDWIWWSRKLRKSGKHKLAVITLNTACYDLKERLWK